MSELISHAKKLLASIEEKQGIEKVLAVMQALRDPSNGCPWDLKQTYQTIIPFTIEEVYEVVEAIELGDFDSLQSELGDLLFQVVFYAQIAKEEGRFDFYQVTDKLCKKLITRHPHVFSDVCYKNEQTLNQAWEAQKQLEREKKTQNISSALDDIPRTLPELKRAQKIQQRAAKSGFDWQHINQVWDKLDEEKKEVLGAANKQNKAELEDELGDLLFTVVNLSRHYRIDADMALRKANQKFEQRFRQVEVSAEKSLNEYDQQQLEVLWNIAKKKCYEIEGS